MVFLKKIRTAYLKKKYRRLDDERIVKRALSEKLDQDAKHFIIDEIKNRNLLHKFSDEKDKQNQWNHKIKKNIYSILKFLIIILFSILSIGHGLDAIFVEVAYSHLFRDGFIILEGREAQIWGISLISFSTLLLIGILSSIYSDLFPNHQISQKLASKSYKRIIAGLMYIFLFVFAYYHFVKPFFV